MVKIELRRQAYKDLEAIPTDYARLISNHIDLLEENPRPTDSKKLKGDAGYSLRVGTYRVLYDIDDKAKTVTIYRIKHRREAYR
ncbi:MAG: type II toxin-antitoxin system RelE/ParE family toxin [Chloroflexi bacterium]|nr:MAG: type II toxin-antitoxin system RelE/ParE family toxin [Chloroflexota bacterium]